MPISPELQGLLAKSGISLTLAQKSQNLTSAQEDILNSRGVRLAIKHGLNFDRALELNKHQKFIMEQAVVWECMHNETIGLTLDRALELKHEEVYNLILGEGVEHIKAGFLKLEQVLALTTEARDALPRLLSAPREFFSFHKRNPWAKELFSDEMLMLVEAFEGFERDGGAWTRQFP